MVLSMHIVCIVNKEGSKLNSDRIKVKVGEISLTKSDHDKGEKLMRTWNMDIEQLCRYAIVNIANTHHSERAEALQEYEQH